VPGHSEKKLLLHTPEQLFDLVADIDKYPEFLPWCAEAKVHGRDGDVLTADMVIGYKVFRERFTSLVTLERPDRIEIALKEGPFHNLSTIWRFLADGKDACIVDFQVEFTFRNTLMETLIGAVFTQAAHRMVASFEARAEEIYGAAKSAGLAPHQPAPNHSTK
jgi:coenzyme Q-binding protein COQ10